MRRNKEGASSSPDGIQGDTKKIPWDDKQSARRFNDEQNQNNKRTAFISGIYAVLWVFIFANTALPTMLRSDQTFLNIL